jgi:hypothetical protein
MCRGGSGAHAVGMFHLNDYRTVRFLVDDHHHTYRPNPRRFLRRRARADQATSRPSTRA